MTTVDSETRLAEPVAVNAAGPPAPSTRSGSTYLSLGYLCFSAPLLLLSLFHTLLVSFDFISVVFPTAIFLGGVAQFIVGVWAYAQRDFLAAVMFIVFAAFWLSYTLYLWVLLPRLFAEHGNAVTSATGGFTLVWGLVVLMITVAARRVNRAVFVLTALSTLMLVAITIGQFAVAPPIDGVGGVFGAAAALVGLYVGAAYLINGSHGRVVLPLGESRGH